MARPRRHNLHLPPCVRYSHGAYYLVQKGKWTRLGKTLPENYRNQTPTTAFTELVDAAMVEIYGRIKESSRRNYKSAVKHIKEALCEYTPAQVTQADVWAFRDQFSAIPVMGNTALSILRDIFKYAVRKRIVLNNPVIGVDRFVTKSRERLIDQSEYQAIYAHCEPFLQCIMDILYLTGQRVNDVIRMSRSQITPEGVYIAQEKTEKKILVQWTPELKDATERAKRLSAGIPSIYLFTNHGKPMSIDRVRVKWIAACKKAGVSDAQMRDLRAMSLTDVEERLGEEAAMRLAAHSSLSVTRGYLRRKRVVKVTGPTRLKPLPQTASNSDLND